jgi:hypothetical protein
MTVPTYITNDAFLIGGQGGEQRECSQTMEQKDYTSRTSSHIDGPSMILLTGPNYSGKSVYQKQIAVAVYMAHIGSFVPADAAVIGMTDKILTRIMTRETVSKMQSAFMIDVQQIARALNQATRRSLVAIDEFGKGTDSCGSSNPTFSPDQYNTCSFFEQFLNVKSELMHYRWRRTGCRRLQVSSLNGPILSKSPRCNSLPRDLRTRLLAPPTQPRFCTHGSARG